jgi:predicted ATPase
MPQVSDRAVAGLLREYPRAIAHMWKQREMGRLVPIFGAGASKEIGFPGWGELVQRIAEHPSVDAPSVYQTMANRSASQITQVLYRIFRQRFLEGALTSAAADGYLEKRVQGEWRSIVHSCLYDGIAATEADLYRRAKTYVSFVQIIQQAPLTITYNFDDSIERVLSENQRVQQGGGLINTGVQERPAESAVDGRLPFRKAKGVIFHPNGYLPLNPLESVGDSLVFDELDFADQLVDAVAGAQATLLSTLTKNSCLLIGLSLTDVTLRHMLRQSARQNPGHYHYYIHHVANKKSTDRSHLSWIAEANFETYNLVTLFLTTSEIRLLGKLLSLEGTGLRQVMANLGVEHSFHYFLTGVPGAGKTTTLRYFGSLRAYDEWPVTRPQALSKAPNAISNDKEEASLDRWVDKNVAIKNSNLQVERERAGAGVSIIDRCPLDAMSFKHPNNWAARAQALRNALARSRVEGGIIILLVGGAEELFVRAQSRGRQIGGSVESMRAMQSSLSEIYSGLPGTRTVDCRGRSPESVAKEVARIIFLDTYDYADLDVRLTELIQRKVAGSLELLAMDGLVGED